MHLKKREKIMSFPNRTIELASELNGLSEIEMKQAFLRGLPGQLDVPARANLGGQYEYHEAVEKCTGPVTRLSDSGLDPEQSYILLTTRWEVFCMW